MEVITPPKYVKDVMKTLEQRDHSTYLVGGCVRDMLLVVRPNDWDISTSATPDEVTDLFEKTEPSGICHGTVTVCMPKGKKVEVTTFRREEGFSDHRRPDSVTYISDLTEDLARRDFTINALALPLSGILVDPYGGRADIEASLIRTVGEPKKRFDEDALRMFRAYRFAARLSFQVEEKTCEGVLCSSHLATTVSAERIREECDKILRSDNPDVIFQVVRSRLLDAFLNGRDIPDSEFDSLDVIPCNKLSRWVGFCAILDKCGLINSVSDFLGSIRLDGNSRGSVSMGLELSKNALPEDKLSWKLLLLKYGQRAVMCASAAKDALCGQYYYQKQLQSVIKSGECYTLKRLDINGDDLIALGYKTGSEIGKALESLLIHVINEPGDNKRNLLITRALYLLQSSSNGTSKVDNTYA